MLTAKNKHEYKTASFAKFFSCLFLLLLVSCLSPDDPEQSVSLKIDLQFKGPVYSGNARTEPNIPKTDWVVWIENADSSFVRTLKVSVGAVTAYKNGGREYHFPVWQAKSGTVIKGTGSSVKVIPPEFDAITSASIDFTHRSTDTTLSVSWDLKDANGKPVPSGTYLFCSEVSNSIWNTGTPLTIVTECAYGSFAYTDGGQITPAAATKNIISFNATIH